MSIAEQGLYQLMKNEEVLMTAARMYDAINMESRFNEMVDAAVADYKIFNANVLKNTCDFECEFLTNFNELFEYVIDVKKERAVLLEQSSAVATTSATNVDDSSSSLSKKQKRK